LEVILKNVHITMAEPKTQPLILKGALDREHRRPGQIISILVLGSILLSLSAISFAPVASAQTGVSVTINNFAFSPATITVVIGVNNTVTWHMEQSGIPYHTVTSDDNSWGSGHLTTGQNFTYTFASPGTYGYHCTLHTYMKGTVIVLGAGGSTQTSSSSSVSEFPTQAIALAVVAALVVASYAVLRHSRGTER
jgi:plastocyanin